LHSGHLSRATRHPAMSVWYAAHGGDSLAIQRVTLARACQRVPLDYPKWSSQCEMAWALVPHLCSDCITVLNGYFLKSWIPISVENPIFDLTTQNL
jgi:hypothetical protein